MSIYKKLIALSTIAAMMTLSTQQLEAVTYVIDTGGYAYDESRAATNLAPAIALGTVAIVGIIAIAVQNTHEHSSSSSSSSKGSHSRSSSSYKSSHHSHN